MTRVDETIDRAADKLQELARKAAAQNGLKAKLAEPLAEDAAFLRKLKPSLIAARARGEAPTDQKPGAGTVVPSAASSADASRAAVRPARHARAPAPRPSAARPSPVP